MTDEERKAWNEEYVKKSLSKKESEEFLLNAVKSGRFSDIWVDKDGKPHVGAMPVRDAEQ